MFVYVVQCELPGAITCYHIVVLKRWFGIFCLCTGALVLLVRVSTWCTFVNMVMNFSSINVGHFCTRWATVTFRRSQLLGVGSFVDWQIHIIDNSVYSMFGMFTEQNTSGVFAVLFCLHIKLLNILQKNTQCFNTHNKISLYLRNRCTIDHLRSVMLDV